MIDLRRSKTLTLVILIVTILLIFGLFHQKPFFRHKVTPSLSTITRGNDRIYPSTTQTKTNVQYMYIDKSSNKTPAQYRANLKDKKCNVYNKTDIQGNFTKAKLKFSKGFAAIYVHNAADVISRRLMDNSSWEGGYIQSMETAFNLDPSLNLIDVGCNLGVYTIVAAMRKRKVVAVDANINNIKWLRKSLLENKIEERVKLLFNGISDKYMQFSISSPEKNNIGHTLLSPLKKNDVNKVNAIYLDDILEVIDFKRAIMKIDIEGHEFEAFHKADKLFTEVQIPAVMMEWDWIGKNANKSIPMSVLQFFKRFNYKPYKDLFGVDTLDVNSYNKWPWDIVWKKH